ncbi:hypothetical protein [Shewanella sp. FJAT-51649]|nr:hypothetical protein [Shewanella sp. FJAT-51649]
MTNNILKMTLGQKWVMVTKWSHFGHGHEERNEIGTNENQKAHAN